jgi:DNA repair exonuclease SbcCD ATPase subunit
MKIINASLAIISTLVIAACSSVQATSQAPIDIVRPSTPAAPKNIDNNTLPSFPEAPNAPEAFDRQDLADRELRFYAKEMDLTIRNNDPQRYMTVDGQTFGKAQVPQAIIDKIAEINVEASAIETQAEIVQQDIKKKMEALKPLLDKMKAKAHAIARLKVDEKMQEIQPKLAAMKAAIKDAKLADVDGIVEAHMRHIEPVLEAVHANIDHAELEDIQEQIEQKSEHISDARMQALEEEMQVFEERLAVKEKELKRLIADFVEQQS